jgi:glycosyltransferase involved in cell wall biosynthesis
VAVHAAQRLTPVRCPRHFDDRQLADADHCFGMSQPPHLCHILSTGLPGGLELLASATIAALGDRYQHTIVALDGNFDAAERIGGAADVRLVVPPRRVRRVYWLPLRSMLRQISPDLLITYSSGAFHGLISGWLFRLCPIVHQEHGFLPGEPSSADWRWLLLRRLLLNRIHATIVPSKSLVRVALTHYRLRRDKIVYIPNGVDLERFRPRRDVAWRRSHGLPDDALVFGTVARLSMEKNLPLMLRAFARVTAPQARLIVVGEGERRAEGEALALQLGLDARVLFTGAARDPAPCYAGFDVFVMSSSTEQMPMALLEAMACGLPAICTDVGDCREMLGGGDGPALVPEGDEARYAAAMTALAQSSELRAALGAANRARCVERYSLDDMIERYASVYDAALGQAAR